jgi:hypothetical protein
MAKYINLVSVKFSDDELEQLSIEGDRVGLPKATLIRLIVKDFLNKDNSKSKAAA